MVESIRELRRICQKPQKDCFYYDRLRTISIYFTKIFLYTSITANQVTLITILLGLVVAILFTFGNYWYVIAGALLLQLAHILDCVDGEIARYRKNFSDTGIWLERVFHRNVSPILLFSLGYGSYISLGDINYLVAGSLISLFLLSSWSIALVRNYYLLLANPNKEISEIKAGSKKVRNKPVHTLLSGIVKICNEVISDNIMATLILVLGLINKSHLIVLFYCLVIPLRYVTSGFLMYFSKKP